MVIIDSGAIFKRDNKVLYDLSLQVFQDSVVIVVFILARGNPRIIDVVFDLKAVIPHAVFFTPNDGRSDFQAPRQGENLVVCLILCKFGVCRCLLFGGLTTVVVRGIAGSLPLLFAVQLQISVVGDFIADLEVRRSSGRIGNSVAESRVFILLTREGVGEGAVPLVREIVGFVLPIDLEITGHLAAARQGILEHIAVHGYTVGDNGDSPSDLILFRIVAAALVQLVMEIDFAILLLIICKDTVDQVNGVRADMIHDYIVLKNIALVFFQCGQTLTVHVGDLDAGVAISNLLVCQAAAGNFGHLEINIFFKLFNRFIGFVVY